MHDSAGGLAAFQNRHMRYDINMPILKDPTSAALVPQDKQPRTIWPSIRRGAMGLCPKCGKGRMFTRYLKVAEACPHCGEALHHHRADDAPPYFTVFAAGHIVIPLMLGVERAASPPLWLHLSIFLPLTALLCLWLLPIFKGATIGLQWANYMHGFDPAESADETQPANDQRT